MIDQYGELAVLQDENAALRHRITELELLHSEQFARARLEQQSGSALPDCEADWQAILDATDEAIIVLAVDGTVLTLNEPAVQRLGGRCDKLIGAQAADRLRADHRRGCGVDRRGAGQWQQRCIGQPGRDRSEGYTCFESRSGQSRFRQCEAGPDCSSQV